MVSITQIIAVSLCAVYQGRSDESANYNYYSSDVQGDNESPAYGYRYYGTCEQSGCGGGHVGGIAKDDRPGAQLNQAELGIVQRAASQAVTGLQTTIQLLEQHRQQDRPIGDLFEQIFSDDISRNLGDESLIEDRLQMVQKMMTEHADRIEYVYCPEDDCYCENGACVVAYVMAGGELGVDDETPFTVHLGRMWWDSPDEWTEGSKAGVLIHEFSHHVFHTLDEGYNFQHPHLDDEHKKRNAAAYQNLVDAVMVARQRDEL